MKRDNCGRKGIELCNGGREKKKKDDPAEHTERRRIH